MEALLQDLRFSLRSLSRNLGFAAVAIVTLGLGIGAATAIFSVVYGVLFQPLPYPGPDRIVSVSEVGPKGERMRFSDPNFLDLRSRNRSLQALAQYATAVVPVASGDEATRLVVAAVSEDFFAALGVAPAIGRSFAGEEQRVGGPPAALVGEGYWRRQLGAPVDLDGLALTIDGRVFSVVGVMPVGFQFPEEAGIWVPRELEETLPSRTAHNWRVVGRLGDGVSLEEARADLRGLARGLREQYGEETRMVDAAVVPLRDALTGRVRQPLFILLGAVSALLLVAWANVVNLSLAQAAARERELAVRTALGAGRGRLLRQFLTEAAVLSLLGGGLGVLLAIWGTDALVAMAPPGLPRLTEIAVHLPVLGFALVVSSLVAAGLGTLTALRATAGARMTAIGEAGRGQVSTATGSRIGRALSAAQLAMTLILLVGAGLLGRSLLCVLSVDPGFRTEGVVTMDLAVPAVEDDAGKARRAAFLSDLLARLREVPGVREAGGISSLPLTRGLADGTFLLLNENEVPQRMEDFERLSRDPARVGEADYAVASEGYFGVLGIPLLDGRLFDERDVAEAPHAALISESLRRLRFPGENPIGRTIEFGNMDGDLRLLTIIGVVGDVREDNLETAPRPTIYVGYRQRPQKASDLAVVLRTDLPTESVVAAARDVLRRLDPAIPPRFGTFDEVVSASLGSRYFNLLLLAAFAATALLLALAGIYGVIAYSVSRRTREIGVRVALGAGRGDIMRMVMGQGLGTAAVGVVIGMAGALAFTRALQSLLFGVTPIDPLTFASVVPLLVATSLLASYVPAHRASRIDPIVALRND